MKIKLGASWGNEMQEGWSFDGICPGCGENKSECRCTPPEILEPKAHRLTFKIEKRNGKPVTVIGPLKLSEEQAQAILKKLKSTLACGGSFKQSHWELQGSVIEKAKELLRREGFGFK
ncbi:MAG: translation initiation factor [Campylobacterales bacterium]